MFPKFEMTVTSTAGSLKVCLKSKVEKMRILTSILTTVVIYTAQYV